MQVKDIMTGNVSTVNSNSNISDAARIMKERDVGAVPVCEGTKPVGIITDRDISIRSIALGGDGNTPVSQVMSSNLIYGTPEMSDKEAARLMAEKQIRRLPILDNNRLVGIVSLGDLAVNDRTDMEAGKALSTISIPSQPK
jgi:CBS domain-containing protein